MAPFKYNSHHELENLKIEMPFRERWYHKLYKVFLLIVVVLVTIFIIHQIINAENSGKVQEIFAQYYEPYQLDSQVRSGITAETNIQKDYPESNINNSGNAIDCFEKAMKNDNTLLFYKGISNIEKGKYNEAVNVFEQALQGKENMYIIQTHWYMSLALLKLNSFDKAKFHLEWLLNNLKENDFYRINATAVLKELNKGLPL